MTSTHRQNHTDNNLINRTHSRNTTLLKLDLNKYSYIALQKSLIIDNCFIVRRFLTSTSQTPTTPRNEPTLLAVIYIFISIYDVSIVFVVNCDDGGTQFPSSDQVQVLPEETVSG